MSKVKLDYFKSPYNYIDMYQYLGTIWVVVSTLGDFGLMSKIAKRNMCTFVLISQGTKAIIDWLRLFDDMSFYVTLIVRTFIDIGYFLFIILILLVYVGNAMYMLHLNANFGEDNEIVQTVFENFIVDSTLNQFNLMIGEFHLDGFKNHTNPGLCYFLFIMTVVISQLTFLNMLIAIMADTFEKVIE